MIEKLTKRLDYVNIIIVFSTTICLPKGKNALIAEWHFCGIVGIEGGTQHVV